MSHMQTTRFFRHYKNKPYKYLGVVRHSETLEELVLYETLYENQLGRVWVRPKEMFFEDVEINGVKKPRFEKIKFRFQASETLSEKEITSIHDLYRICFNKELNQDKFQSKLKFHSQGFFLTCFEGDKLIGFKLGYAQDKDLFYSWHGAVLPDYQSLGVASELMNLQHEWCQKNGFKKIETRTRNHFLNMIRLNLKFGFKIIGTQSSAVDDIKIVLEKLL